MAVSNNLGLYLPTREDYISITRDISDNLRVIDAAAGQLDIIVSGNTSSVSVLAGQYVTVINSTIEDVIDGIYQATANVSSGTPFIASNLATVTSGALNDLHDLVAHVDVGTVITDLDTITLNSKGRLYLGASVSPTGAAAGYSYLCVGVNAGKTLVVWSSATNKEWTNSKNSSGWIGWHSVQDEITPQKMVTDATNTANRTYTVPANSRYYLVGLAGNSNNCFTAILVVNSTGAIAVHQISKGSNVTFDTATAYKFKVTFSSASSCNVLVFASTNAMIDGFTQD